MDSQDLINNGKTIFKKLFQTGKISGDEYTQLVGLILEIRVKSASEWIMNDVIFQDQVKKRISTPAPGTQK